MMNLGGGQSFFWMMSGFDPRGRFESLKRQVNSHGGVIDQSYFYLDHQSALDWCNVSNYHGFSINRSIGSELVNWVSDSILFHLKGSRFDSEQMKLISLGSGEVEVELQLISSLQTKHSVGVDLCLLDASYLLLYTGYRNAHGLLPFKKKNSIHAIHGDFYQLHEMPTLFLSPEESPRQLRVGCMFGATFSNLPNDVHFIQESLSAFHSGDLLIVDVTIGVALPHQKEEILKKDPRFLDYAFKESWEDWIQGPIKRYREDLRKLEISSVLETRSCQIPGSYNVLVQANINDEINMNLIRIRRYEPNELIKAFNELGWRSLGGKVFAGKTKQLVCIFEKI